MNDSYRYPFGRPVGVCAPSSTGPRRAFVLGAYPSALHVRWKGVAGDEISALPVDDEPEPFWTGTDEGERIDAWKSAIGFDAAAHGTVAPVGQLNGSSGRALDTDYLEPLGISREDA